MRVGFGSLPEVPEDLTIHFTEVDFISDKELTFDFEPVDVDFNDTEEKSFQYDQKVKEFKGSEIYFKGLKQRRDDWFIVLNQLNEENSDEYFIGRRDHSGIQGQQGNKVSIANDENSFSSVDHGMYIEENGESGYLVESYFLNNSETVYFKLERLIYGVEIEESVDIDLSGK
ncbi:hypothetical protein CEY16_10235 [Halalkalibacillus sediminis]|uniref:Uncharacterized protein n=1 Tax=Halalkalibacillus sediminis TaxID=2018042 RepID=A0A2I0QRY8_9BACI|nr:hypothetical protein [Halalkalibacillus sediminis]PKR77115.1 hypothetical protein CEY16_10235 [Halalkalibacillus sediminis]